MRVIIGIVYLVMIFLSTTIGGFSHVYNNMDQCGDTCSAAAQSKECNCRCYSFAFTFVAPWSFMNATTGEMYGPAVDLVKRVCEIAGKCCRFSGTGHGTCWNGQFSEVLNGRWYDACAVIADPPERRAKYDYMEIAICDLGRASVWANPSSNITLDQLRNQNDFKLGLLSTSIPLLERALEAFIDEGYFIKDKNILRQEGDFQGDFDAQINQLVSALECENSGIDFVLVPPAMFPSTTFELIGELEFDYGNISIMMRKDEQCLRTWYGEAYKQLICSDEYPAFCQQLTEATDNQSNMCRDRNAICS